MHDPLSRRELLRRGVWGTPLLAAATGLAACSGGCAGYAAYVRDEDAARLQFFTPKQFAIATAAADVLLPGPADGFPDHRELGIVRQLDAELSQWEPVRSADLPLLLSLLEHGTLLFGHSLSRMSRLDLEDRRVYLAGWGDSGLNVRRSGFIALKGLLAFYYFAHPATWPAIGYDGPWMDRFEIPAVDVGLPA